MSVWSDHQYLLKYHPEVTGYEVVSGTKVAWGLVIWEWARSNLANVKYLRWFRPNLVEKEVLVFAETVNQHVSLKPMVVALGDRCRYVQVAHFEEPMEMGAALLLERKFELTFLDWISALLKSTILIPHVLLESRRYSGGLRQFYVRQLFRSCGYWYWLKSLLRQSPSRWVLTANDHNPLNRMLCALSNRDGRKTAYVQHASVSDIFPPLDFDVAFLDGQVSMDIYERIAGQLEKAFAAGQICLCGTQKRVVGCEGVNASGVMGIATSSLTELDVAQELISRLSSEGWQIVLRSHPTEAPERLDAYLKWASAMPGVQYQEGSTPLRQFFAEVGTVMAGDSSILLEAAVAGRGAVYVRSLSGRGLNDHYGFVQNGIALSLEASADLGTQLRGWEDYMLKPEYSNCLTLYSASFGTKWEGKEGQWAVRQWEGLGLVASSGDS